MRLIQNNIRLKLIIRMQLSSLSTSKSTTILSRNPKNLIKMRSQNFNQHPSSPKQQAHSNGQINLIGFAQKQQQIGQMQLFVEQFAAKPRLIVELVDYTQLVENARKQKQQIQNKLEVAARQFDNLKKSILQMSESNEYGTIRQLKRSAQSIKQQLAKIDLLTKNVEIQRKNKKQLRLQKQNKLKHQIRQMKQKNKFNGQKIIQLKKIKAAQHSDFSNKISSFQRKILELRKKTQANQTKQNDNNLLKQKLRIVKAEQLQLKQTQNQYLLSYKNKLMVQKNSEAEMKKNTQKKLNKFVSQLRIIVEKGDETAYRQLVFRQQQKMLKIRDKNPSQVTKPDQNDDNNSINDDDKGSAQRDSLNSLEQQNPILKQYRELKIANIEQYAQKYSQKRKSQIDSQLKQMEQYNKKSKQADQKIRKLDQEESQLNYFIQSLREKVSKVNAQLGAAKSKK